MQRATILLNAIVKAKEFVEIAKKQPYNIDVSTGHYAVDGTSILGIFSIDLTRKLELTVHSDETDALEPFEKFVVV